MGKFLHALGAHAFERKWLVVGGWVLIVVVLGLLALQFIKPTSSALSIPGTEAQKTLDRFSELFPDAGQGSARVIVAAPEGKTVQDYSDNIASMSEKIAAVDGVATVISPLDNPMAVSENKTIAYAQLQLDGTLGTIESSTMEGVARIVDETRRSGLTVEMGGDIIDKQPADILGVGEIGGVVLALVVLLMTLGSLIAAGMPIVIALVTVATSMAGLFALSEVIDINATTPVLAVMLGLAVGIDYSLFIINKYRHYLLLGFRHKDAAGKAVATAGNAVLFAAATVVIALAALTIVQIPFMTTMGLAGAATVALAAIVAVTLIPALLGFAGDKIFGGKTRKAIAAAQAKGPKDAARVSHKTLWYRWGEAITRRPVTVLVAAIVVVAAIAWPVKDLTLGLPTDQYAATDATERKAYDLLAKGFGPGFNGPLLLVVEDLPPVSAADKSAIASEVTAQFEARMAEEKAKQEAAFAQKAAQATTPEAMLQLQQEVAAAQAAGEAQRAAAEKEVAAQIALYTERFELNKIAERIAKDSTVAQALPVMVTSDGKNGVIQVTSTDGPSSEATHQLIERLRSTETQSVLVGDTKATFGVTGSTALQIDINDKLSAALPQYLAVVVGLSLVLLVIAFRSILVPLKATLGFLLSVLAMFGAVVAVFQFGWFGIADAPGPIVSFIPIIATGILFGLAMDYEFFLVSGMHEEYTRTKNAKRAVANGFGLGSKVVTAAGVIMVAVFAGFIFNHDSTIQTIGFGLAIGILIDAFIVRMTIVPAVMTLLGKRAWWLPKWLDRILPHISIEGEDDTPATKAAK